MAPLQVVLDTSIIIASLRSRRGASALLMSLLVTGRFDIHVSTPLVLEYEEILIRQQQELGLSLTEIADFVHSICAVARHREIHFTWRPSLPDQSDVFILDLAVAAGCGAIVTYNKRDFAGIESLGIRLLTAQEFLREIGVIS